MPRSYLKKNVFFSYLFALLDDVCCIFYLCYLYLQMAKPVANDTAAPAEAGKVSHPKYMELVTHTIKELKDRKGSTKPKIANRIIASYVGLDAKLVSLFCSRISPICIYQVRRQVGKALEKGLMDGTFSQTDGLGLKGRFKIAQPGSAPVVQKKSAPSPKKVFF